MISILEDESADFYIRCYIAKALCQIGGAPAMTPVRRFLTMNKQNGWADGMIHVLAGMIASGERDDDVIETLCRLARSGRNTIEYEVDKLSRLVDDPRITVALSDSLETAEHVTLSRCSLLESRADWVPTPGQQIITAFTQQKFSEAEAIGQNNLTDVPALLNHPDRNIRLNTCVLLGRIGDGRALESLTRAAANDQHLREPATTAIAVIRSRLERRTP